MIRLLLVDDQILVRDGIKAVLNLEPDLEVVGVAENGEVALEQVVVLQPDVVLMDMRMPVMSGITATQLMCERYPSVKVLALSTFDDDQYIAEAIRAGAKGYLLKDMPFQELADAIRFIYRGYTQMAPGLMERLMAKTPESSAKQTEAGLSETAGFADLTAREVEVMRLVGVGATNREIAQQLFISEGTVKSHLTSIFNRLSLKNRSQLAIYAISVMNSGDLT
jgi:DNA-binding NarL/FixJ family response regulator